MWNYWNEGKIARKKAEHSSQASAIILLRGSRKAVRWHFGVCSCAFLNAARGGGNGVMAIYRSGGLERTLPRPGDYRWRLTGPEGRKACCICRRMLKRVGNQRRRAGAYMASSASTPV